ncbi:hypothetical protein NLJ89_g9098 [Agrocybe chaxingu]|uniref:Uncharacterized protein n=1 Tax=Agrocybe chaxingu TaxID=84603 RepID=A0A9W8MS56_9AGAR|nr:hypothetical protein NLJ89_g9098 [Agrocybe chaxingu]
MVQLSTSAFVAAVALSIPVSVLAGPVNTIEERDVTDGSIELNARFDDAQESVLERGFEDHEDLESRVIGHLWNGLRNTVLNGGARRVVTAPVRNAIQTTHKNNEAKKKADAGSQANRNIKQWHDTTRKVIAHKKAGTRRELEDLEAREMEELEARVLGHLWQGVRNTVLNGGARRVVTAPVRNAVVNTHKDNQAKQQLEANRQAANHAKQQVAAQHQKRPNPDLRNKWKDTIQAARAQQLQHGRKKRELNEELEAREDWEGILEVREWAIEDLD